VNTNTLKVYTEVHESFQKTLGKEKAADIFIIININRERYSEVILSCLQSEPTSEAPTIKEESLSDGEAHSDGEEWLPSNVKEEEDSDDDVITDVKTESAGECACVVGCVSLISFIKTNEPSNC